MKNFMTICLIVAGCFQAIYAQDDEKTHTMMVSGGTMVEINWSGFAHSGYENGQSDMKPGLSVGGFVNICVSPHFAVQGELSFTHKHSDFGWEDGRGCYRYWGMEIPIYAMYHHTLHSGGRIYIGVGPYTNFGIDASFEGAGGKLDLYENDADTGLPPMRSSDTGFSIKTGYELPCGLQVNVSYKRSISNLTDPNSSHVKMHSQTLSLGLAWHFGKQTIK